MPDLRGGLIGCGFFAHNHVHGWREAEVATIVAVCDTNAQRVEALAQEVGASAFAEADTMLRETNLDFVDIVTQPNSHRALVELAAFHKVPVICQKPLAPSREDARAMVAACNRAGIPFMVHENFRWQRPMRALKQASQEVGDLFFGRILFRSGYNPAINQPYLAEDPRFILYDVGVHILDLARFFLGEAVQLTCLTQRINSGIQGEDVATVLLKMASGATCIVELSYASPSTFDPFPQTLVHLEGANGSVDLGLNYRLALDIESKKIETLAQPEIYSWSVPPFEVVQDSVVAIQRHWVECLRDGKEPETSGADNLKTLELVFGSYQSAETGQLYIP